jgi:hypothetical protein
MEINKEPTEFNHSLTQESEDDFEEETEEEPKVLKEFQLNCPKCQHLSPYLIAVEYVEEGVILKTLCQNCGLVHSWLIEKEKETAPISINKSPPSYLG